MLLVPIMLIALSVCAISRKERVERMQRAFHLGADYCDTTAAFLMPISTVLINDIKEVSIAEALSALEYEIDGKNAIERARSKPYKSCQAYGDRFEVELILLQELQESPEAKDDLLVKEVVQRVSPREVEKVRIFIKKHHEIFKGSSKKVKTSA